MPPSYGDPCGPVIDAFFILFFFKIELKKINLKYSSKIPCQKKQDVSNGFALMPSGGSCCKLFSSSKRRR